MIPNFPDFKHIEWSDKADVEQFTNEFPPYSDFNFVSLWSWNTREKMKVSQLHGNLVLLFYDYLTETPFLSFIGKNRLADTSNALIEYSLQKFQVGYLKLIPEAVAVQLCQEQFCICPDEDSHDYIFSVAYLRNIGNLANASNPAARFYKKYIRLYPHHTVKSYSRKDIPADECIDLFKRWAKVKCLNHLELNEYSAFVKFINNTENSNTIVAIYDGNAMIAFAAVETVSTEYAIGHFLKADKSYAGINEAMHVHVCEHLFSNSVPYWNYEQDLGIPQLRQSKKKYKPVFYLKKFIVQKR